jgi:hypothetical protein
VNYLFLNKVKWLAKMNQKNHDIHYNKKTFFSQNFNISFQFYPKGGLRGKVIDFPNTFRLTKTLEGLYLIEESAIRLSFTTEWKSDDLISKALSCFSGVIFSYDEHSECLFLKWLNINESNTSIGSCVERSTEVLFDCCSQNFLAETKKIIGRIPVDLLE